jgi:alkylation response protein AidB-like acyl-CoA dehydrogenase
VNGDNQLSSILVHVPLQQAAREPRMLKVGLSFPRDEFRLLGKQGILSLPSDERYRGGDVPDEVSLQVIEEVAANWATVGVRRRIPAHPSDPRRG